MWSGPQNLTARWKSGAMLAAAWPCTPCTTTPPASARARQPATCCADHLGGVHALVDLDGPVQAMAFGPWGQRRGAGDWTALSKPAQASASHTNITTRGFTGHEMLDTASLVHMNGRLYSPELGRFLQADPFIQFLAHTQGHNRYSYALNNPASLTDPTGHFVGGVAILAAQVLATHLVHKHVLSQVPLLNAVANVLACAYGGAPGCINFAVHSAYARTGSFGAALEAGVLSAVSVAAFDAVGASAAFGYGSGDGFGRLAMNALANGVVGGIANELQGGRFGHGFMSAGGGRPGQAGDSGRFRRQGEGRAPPHCRAGDSGRDADRRHRRQVRQRGRGRSVRRFVW